MTVAPELLWSVIGFLVVTMIAVIGWFIRKDYKRLEDGLQEERRAREQELKNEREARGKDRHDQRAELMDEVARRHAFELKVTLEYPNMGRLGETLLPLKEAVDQMRADQRELFSLVHTKQDKGAD